MKALVGAFNQEKALVGAFSVIVQPVVEPMDRFAALIRSSYHTLMTRQVLQLLTGDTVASSEEAGADIAGEMKACRDLNNDQNIYRY